ncbi:NAD(P)-dependent oxidoreductase [Teredinibacter sp. KSP-S5-2]|uniref:NAD-dependent epimerase/dehydratase family protein n=1 Tax=Teredinibacter sp. KSP-S5-2 TaxID=3034506 RepID=UPI0029349699|nr:NAD(P)-dependent oxidoreductase [Teredinibacter sp. KSP-S5-2]WNO07848.1 NAD(P)-dependent oxidoreductase [Teredinibacter sp. KSP-S5-2]
MQLIDAYKPVVLVTGATGFIGRYLCKLLRSRYPQSRIIGLGKSPSTQASDNAKTKILDEFHSVDLCDMHSSMETLSVVPEPDYVFHLAGAFGNIDLVDLWRLNLGLTINLFSCMSKVGFYKSKIIVAGSAAEYDYKKTGVYDESDPIGGQSGYGKSKAAASMAALFLSAQYGLSTTIARPFNVIGLGMSDKLVLGKLSNQILSGCKEIRLGRLDSIRDFIDVEDVAEAFIQIAINGSTGTAYNVCTGKGITIGCLAEKVVDISRSRVPILSDVGPTPTGDSDKAVGDNSKLFNELGWTPKISLVDSIQKILRV